VLHPAASPQRSLFRCRAIIAHLIAPRQQGQTANLGSSQPEFSLPVADHQPNRTPSTIRHLLNCQLSVANAIALCAEGSINSESLRQCGLLRINTEINKDLQ